MPLHRDNWPYIEALRPIDQATFNITQLDSKNHLSSVTKIMILSTFCDQATGMRPPSSLLRFALGCLRRLSP
jgi:hypothetical protein